MTQRFLLRLYKSVKADTGFLADISKTALNWRRTTRLQGGFWMGSFEVRDKISVLQDWFYNALGYHISESYGNATTWEGFVAEMDLDDTGDKPVLYVTCLGYVHTMAWRHVTAANGALGNLSVWLNDLITTDCAEFLTVGRIQTNTLQVYRRTESARRDQRVWDEVTRMVAMGDASGNPYQCWVGTNRKFFYGQIPTTPMYYARGGFRWRRSLLETYNYISGEYTDSTGNPQALTASTNATSTAKLGRREYWLTCEDASSTAAEAQRDKILKEHAWAYIKAVGARDSVKLYSGPGDNVGYSPWEIKCGVVRDLRYPLSRAERSGWLTDVRDVLVEEVEASAAGVTLRTTEFEESSLYGAQVKMEPWEEQNEFAPWEWPGYGDTGDSE